MFDQFLDIFSFSIESIFSSTGISSQDVKGADVSSIFKPGNDTKYLEEVEICHTAVGHIHSMAVATNGQVISISIKR